MVLINLLIAAILGTLRAVLHPPRWRTESLIEDVCNRRMMPRVRTVVVRGISYFAVAQLLALLLTLLMVAVLTRILSPEDFGIASLGIVFVALFAVIQEFGIAAAVIQRDSEVEEAISNGLALRWIIGGILFVFILAISPIVADFYSKPSIEPVLMVLSTSLMIQPFGFASYVTLSRNLKFLPLSIASISQSVIFTISSILFALIGQSYWSIVYGSLLGSASYVIVVNCYGHVPIRPRLDRLVAKDLMRFGSHLVVTSLMTYAIFNVDQLLVGKALGLVALGTYFIAVRFSRAISEQVASPICKALFPTMARMKNSLEQMKTTYLQALRMMVIALAPLAFGTAAISKDFVSVILGKEFIAAGPLISIMAFQGFAFAVTLLIRNVLVAFGRPKYLTVQSSIQAALVGLLVYPVAVDGSLNSVGYLVTALSFFSLAYLSIVLSRLLGLSVADMLKAVAPPIISSTATYISVYTVLMFMAESAASIVVGCAAGVCTYLIVLHISSAGKDVKDFLGLLRELI